VLGLVSSGMNFSPGKQLAGALEALDKGETVQMLRPLPTRRKHQPASLDNIRLAALQFVEYRRGTGMTKEDALVEVADSLGCTTDAIKQWERRLPRTMDTDYVLERLKLSRLCGNLVVALTEKRRRSKIPPFQPRLDFDDPETRARIGKYAQIYGADQLKLTGQKFRELEKAVKRKRTK
jgi:hypothetical protein